MVTPNLDIYYSSLSLALLCLFLKAITEHYVIEKNSLEEDTITVMESCCYRILLSRINTATFFNLLSLCASKPNADGFPAMLKTTTVLHGLHQEEGIVPIVVTRVNAA